MAEQGTHFSASFHKYRIWCEQCGNCVSPGHMGKPFLFFPVGSIAMSQSIHLAPLQPPVPNPSPSDRSKAARLTTQSENWRWISLCLNVMCLSSLPPPLSHERGKERERRHRSIERSFNYKYLTMPPISWRNEMFITLWWYIVPLPKGKKLTNMGGVHVALIVTRIYSVTSQKFEDPYVSRQCQ